jgi:hypothetical protein
MKFLISLFISLYKDISRWTPPYKSLLSSKSYFERWSPSAIKTTPFLIKKLPQMRGEKQEKLCFIYKIVLLNCLLALVLIV